MSGQFDVIDSLDENGSGTLTFSHSLTPLTAPSSSKTLIFVELAIIQVLHEGMYRKLNNPISP